MEFDAVVPINNELERRIHDAFCLFDVIGNKTIDSREVGTILRFLGCAPTEHEIELIVTACELEEYRGTIHLSRFLPLMCHVVTERRMEPASPDKLLEAFQVLDPEGNTFVMKDYLSKIMIEEGEPLSQEELDKMMSVASNQKGIVPYMQYLKLLVFEPKDSIYEIAAKLEAERIAALPQPKTVADFLKSNIQA